MSSIESRIGRTDIVRHELKHIQMLNRFVDFGIGSVLMIAPLVMAGRFAPGRLLLAILVSFTAISWFLTRVLDKHEDKAWFWTGIEWIAGSAILLVVMQVIPWSPQTLEMLSPAVSELLPLHGNAAFSDGWNRVSLAPHATRNGLAMAMIYVLFFFVVLQRVRRKADIEKLLKGIALAGIVMASIGLAQYAFSNGKFLWFMEHPSRDTSTVVKGTFANENHFGHFLAMSLGPLLWWLFKSMSADKTGESKRFYFGSSSTRSSLPRDQVLLSIGLGIVLLAGLLSFSRGGLAVMALASVTTIGCLAIQRRVGKRAITAAAAAVVIAALAVWIHGQEILSRELETLQSLSVESLDQGHGRRKIWTAVMNAAPNFATLGSGVGSHRYVYPTYFSSQSNVQYTHAESGYLNVFLETGGPGLGLLLVAIGFSAYWIASAIKNEKQELQFLAVPIAAGWIVSVAHAIFDFNWFIPANMCLTLVVIAISARLWDMTREQTKTARRIVLPRLTWCSLAGVACVMALFSVSQFVGPARSNGSWNEYRAWSLASKRFAAKSTGPGRQKSLGFINASQPDTVARMIQLLEETLKHDPGHGRAHIRMAAMCLRQFELLQSHSDNAMSLAQIRDAALTSGFESQDEMRSWVQKVVGENYAYLERVLWHSRAGLRKTPTEGNGYLYLGEVAFLDPSLANTEFELLRQAYTVRPYDPGIQFAFGRQLMLAGETEVAMQLWKDAFDRGDQVRRRIIAAIGFQAPPQEILDVFHPNVEGLRDLFEYYRRGEMETQMNFVGPKYVAALEQQAKLVAGKTAGQLWLDAQFAHEQLGNVEEAAVAAKNAVLAQPGAYKNHFACACRMRDAGRIEEAIKEFRWCEFRNPDDAELPKVITQLKRELKKSQLISANAIESQRLSR